jgi:sugar phosphate isomerase/epimerase
MRQISRRRFIARSAAGLVAAGAACHGALRLGAKPLGLPAGLQLWTLKDVVEKDFDGTLRQVAAIGYEEVELYTFLNRSAASIRKSLDDAGLRCRSAHFSVATLQKDLPGQIAYAKELGLEYMICPFPAVADPARFTPAPKNPMEWTLAIWSGMTLDDWRWLADVFNKAGEQTKKAGIQFGYHNHNMEFRAYDGVLAFDELMRRADPDLVKVELDCGWVAAAGHDPAAILAKHPGRFPLLHVKDLKQGAKPSTGLDGAPSGEVGSGAIDWKKVFSAAKAAGVKGYYVEQEAPFARPPLEAIKISYSYLDKLEV